MSKARVEPRGGVVELVLDAPPLNLFDDGMLADVEQALDEVESMNARALLFRAEGKVFCAGVDVRLFQDRSGAEGEELFARFLRLSHRLTALPFPTLAVVHGLNVTIGFELALGCDLLWAGESAAFGLIEATVGLTPAAGGTQRLVARCGQARAAEIVLTGDRFPAEVLRDWGVVNRVVEDGLLLEEARAYADRLAAGPTRAAAVGKRLLHLATAGLDAADEQTAALGGPVLETEDLQGGVRSLLTDGPGKATFRGR